MEKKFYAKGFIHKKNGGDDKPFCISFNAENKDKAKELTRDWLKRKSVLEDFVILTEEEFQKSQKEEEELLRKLEKEVEQMV